jgi:hypothetical protein
VGREEARIMDTIERVAREICRADGNDPDEDYIGTVRYWELYRKESQAAIDAMQPDIAEADRKAREECVEICLRMTDNYSIADDCADAIRETMK